MRTRTQLRRNLMQALATCTLGLGLVGMTGSLAAATDRVVSVGVEAQSDTLSTTDGVDSYRLVVVNRNGGQTKGITLSLPVQSGYQLVGASFDQRDAWVSARTAEGVVIRIEQLQGTDASVAGTLRFAGSGPVNAVTERIDVSWGDERSSLSNLPGFGAQTLALSGSAARPQVQSGIFASGEPVTFWVTNAGGASTPLVVIDGVIGLTPPSGDDDDDDDSVEFSDFISATREGAINLPLSVAGLPGGVHTLAARGNWSGAIAAASLRVP